MGGAAQNNTRVFTFLSPGAFSYTCIPHLAKCSFRENPGMVAWNMKKDRTLFYSLMLTVASSRAKNEVRRLGESRIHELWSAFQRYYAKGIAERREELEHLTDEEYSDELENRMEEDKGLVEHIQGFENLLRKLRELVSASELETSKYSNPVEVSRCLAKGLPFKYISQLQVIKFIAARVEETRNSGEPGSNSTSTLGVGNYSKLKYPPFDYFKALLLSIHESERAIKDYSDRNNRRSKASSGKGKTPVFMLGSSGGSIDNNSSLNPQGKVPGGCWDCGNLDHHRGDDSCPHPGSFAFAPVANSNREHNKTNSNSGAQGRGSDSNSGNSKVCYFWKKRFCKYAERCKFVHPGGPNG